MTTTEPERPATIGPQQRSRLRSAARRAWRVAVPRLTLPGAWFALVFACLSFLPSLIPRPAVYQGVITGIDAAIAYGSGVLIARLWREFADRDPRIPSARAWRVFAIVAVVAIAVSMVLGLRWQWQLRELMGADDESLLAGVWIPVLAWAIFVALLWVARGIRWATRTTGGWFSRFMGPRAARATGLVVVALLIVLAVSDVLWRSLISAADSSFALSDQITPGGAVQPSAPERSGSSESLVGWDSLGYQGKAFVAGGPTATDIEAFTGAPAQEPIRAFAGMDTAEDIEDRVRLAVDDLERAGGFARESLLVATTTGTGWIDPGSAAAFEFITGGDSAIVSVQYSHLPSPLSYLTDQERARDAGRELFDEVFYRWSQLPADARPELYVFGESLGSFGAETAFSGERDLANRLSGAVFVGPPHFNPLYRDFVDDRASDSAEIEPVYRDGRIVRFTNDPDDPIQPVGEPWDGSRILYVQNSSDPITWWNWSLLYQEPAWLEEPRGDDVLDAVRWFPVVTFWQMAADMALSTGVPPGHGHNYTGELVSAWAVVLQPAGWTTDRQRELRDIILDDYRTTGTAARAYANG